MWICAKVTGRARRAVFDIERRTGLQAFSPVIHHYFEDRRTRQERYRVKDLFVGYIFVNIKNNVDRDAVKNNYFVSYILGSWVGESFVPKEIPSQYVTTIIENGPLIENKHVDFKKGHKVKRAVGHLAEVIGEVEGIDKSGRLIINEQWFGTIRRVHAFPRDVKPVEFERPTYESGLLRRQNIVA